MSPPVQVFHCSLGAVEARNEDHARRSERMYHLPLPFGCSIMVCLYSAFPLDKPRQKPRFSRQS